MASTQIQGKTGFGGLRVISFESRRAFEMESLIERHGGKAEVAASMREIPFEVNREAVEFARKVVSGKAEVVILMTGVGTRFLLQVIEKLNAKLEKVVIDRLHQNTFFAKLVVRGRGDQEIVVDARPSDSVALALRAEAPIFASEEVMGEAGVNEF